MLASAPIHSRTGHCCASVRPRAPQSASVRIVCRKQTTCSSRAKDLATCGPGCADPVVAALSLYLTTLGGPAAAAELSYNNAGGSEVIRNVAGTLYVVLLAFFAGRLFIKRANRNRNQKFGAPAKQRVRAAELLDEAADRFKPATSPLSALGGAAQAGFLCFLLYLLSSSLDGTFDKTQLPSNFTARNITLTVQTIVRAVSYLFTFICAVNTVGLTGLTIQLLLFPEKENDFSKSDDEP